MPITNTTKQDPTLHLMEAMFTKNPIEKMEARGQTELVNSASLPTDMRPSDREALEAAGVVFGAAHDGDPIFCHVTLPTGWRKVATDHSMWSNLLDANGRKRAMIFYKAAFYDRSARLHCCPRYNATADYDTNQPQVEDGGVAIWTGTPIPVENEKPWEANEKARELAQAWLSERRPDYMNVTAYWDEPGIVVDGGANG